MTNFRFPAALLAAIVLLAGTPALAASKATPKPHPAATPFRPPKMPTVPLHSEFLVEVNAKGQVAHVKSRKGSKVPMYNLWTYGNVLQMWIRHPDGTAEVGLYKVTYDYDPKTHKIARVPSLVKAGGNWGNDEGAADHMIDIARKEAAAHAAKQRAEAKNLPSLKAIRGETATPSPTPASFLHPTPAP